MYTVKQGSTLNRTFTDSADPDETPHSVVFARMQIIFNQRNNLNSWHTLKHGVMWSHAVKYVCVLVTFEVSPLRSENDLSVTLGIDLEESDVPMMGDNVITSH